MGSAKEMPMPALTPAHPSSLLLIEEIEVVVIHLLDYCCVARTFLAFLFPHGLFYCLEFHILIQQEKFFKKFYYSVFYSFYSHSQRENYTI
jgi:hypothetical protein